MNDKLRDATSRSLTEIVNEIIEARESIYDATGSALLAGERCSPEDRGIIYSKLCAANNRLWGAVEELQGLEATLSETRVPDAQGWPYETALLLAAISTACGQNTRESAKQRIGKDNPYWTPAYEDACRAVDREMALREKLEDTPSATRENDEDCEPYMKEPYKSCYEQPSDKHEQSNLPSALRSKAKLLPDNDYVARGLMNMAADRLDTLEARLSATRSNVAEECAKICEARAVAWDASVREGSEQRGYEETVLMECAAAIRREYVGGKS